MLRLIFLVGGMLIISGCAKRADAIVPVSIPIEAYTNIGCPELNSELVRQKEYLAILTKEQDNAATGDAIGMLLLAVPTASVTGHDKSGELATTKGRVIAIESAITSKECLKQS